MNAPNACLQIGHLSRCLSEDSDRGPYLHEHHHGAEERGRRHGIPQFPRDSEDTVRDDNWDIVGDELDDAAPCEETLQAADLLVTHLNDSSRDELLLAGELDDANTAQHLAENPDASVGKLRDEFADCGHARGAEGLK